MQYVDGKLMNVIKHRIIISTRHYGATDKQNCKTVILKRSVVWNMKVNCLEYDKWNKEWKHASKWYNILQDLKSNNQAHAVCRSQMNYLFIHPQLLNNKSSKCTNHLCMSE